ncbi:hypothetical protein [Paradesulfitobacterium aromaticivorans]
MASSNANEKDPKSCRKSQLGYALDSARIACDLGLLKSEKASVAKDKTMQTLKEHLSKGAYMEDIYSD